MKMDNDQLIWKYLDGSCSAREKDIFNSLLHGDPSFKLDYEHALLIHKTLSTFPLQKAPDGLIAKTLSQIDLAPNSKLSSFPLFLFLICIGVLGITGLVLSNPHETGNYIIPYLDQVNFSIDIDWTLLRTISNYSLILLGLPILYFLDHVLKQRMTVQRF